MSRFVKQYYQTLASVPEQLHRFYEDESQFQHFHGPDDSFSAPIRGQSDIHKKILSLGLEVGQIAVSLEGDGSLDCQRSAGGGILLTVTGWLVIWLLNCYVVIPLILFHCLQDYH